MSLGANPPALVFYIRVTKLGCMRGTDHPSFLPVTSLVPSGPGRGTVTAQGHPRAVFMRAIEHGNLLIAETTLRELGRPTLGELVELTALIAHKDVGRARRVAARWLFKYLEAKVDATIDDAQLAAACLAALGGRQHIEALTTLRAMAEEASGGRARRDTA